MASNQNAAASATAEERIKPGAVCARPTCGEKYRHHIVYRGGKLGCKATDCPAFLVQGAYERAKPTIRFLMPLGPGVYQEVQAITALLEARMRRSVGLTPVIRALVVQRLSMWTGPLTDADMLLLRAPIKVERDPTVWHRLHLAQDQSDAIAVLAGRAAAFGEPPRALPAMTTTVLLAQLRDAPDLVKLEDLIRHDRVKVGRPITGRNLRSPVPARKAASGAA